MKNKSLSPQTKIIEAIDRLFFSINLPEYQMNDSPKDIIYQKKKLFCAAIQTIKANSIPIDDPIKPWLRYLPPIDLGHYIIPGTQDPSLSRSQYGLLHLAILQYMDDKIIQDLLQLGCDPNWFAAGVTPIGGRRIAVN